MEEISKIAKGYNQASTDELQNLARDFFKAMDNDGDGEIDLNEFTEFMKEEGRDQMANRLIFNQLDRDRNGRLDFFEVMTLYYIIKSGRPFCDYCKQFITSTYLTCVGCLEDPNRRPFYLCPDCYVMRKCDHTHNKLSRFLDNYSLLEVMTKLKFGKELRSSDSRSRPMEINSVSVPDKQHPVYNHTWNPSLALVQVPQQPPPVHNPHLWNQNATPNSPFTTVVHNHTWIQNNYSYNYTFPHHVQHPNTTNAIIPQRQNWKIALGVLNTAIQISEAGSSLCSIL